MYNTVNINNNIKNVLIKIVLNLHIVTILIIYLQFKYIRVKSANSD